MRMFMVFNFDWGEIPKQISGFVFFENLTRAIKKGGNGESWAGCYGLVYKRRWSGYRKK